LIKKTNQNGERKKNTDRGKEHCDIHFIDSTEHTTKPCKECREVHTVSQI
jgi:hypothetical protein